MSSVTVTDVPVVGPALLACFSADDWVSGMVAGASSLSGDLAGVGKCSLAGLCSV